MSRAGRTTNVLGDCRSPLQVCVLLALFFTCTATFSAQLPFPDGDTIYQASFPETWSSVQLSVGDNRNRDIDNFRSYLFNVDQWLTPDGNTNGVPYLLRSFVIDSISYEFRFHLDLDLFVVSGIVDGVADTNSRVFDVIANIADQNIVVATGEFDKDILETLLTLVIFVPLALGLGLGFSMGS